MPTHIEYSYKGTDIWNRRRGNVKNVGYAEYVLSGIGTTKDRECGYLFRIVHDGEIVFSDVE